MMISIDATTMERMTAVAMEPSGAAATPSAAGLAAQSTERLDRGRPPSSFVGVNLWVAIGAALLMHVAILAPLWLQFENSPIASPETQEIPVEVVVEQPQPTPKPSAEASLPKPPIYIPPADDAPKAATDDKATPRGGVSAKKNAEKAPPDQAQSGEKDASRDEAAPTEPSPNQSSEAKSEAEPLPPGDDAFALPQVPAAVPAPASPAKVATMLGEPLPNWSKGKQLSIFEPVPDVDFGDKAASAVGGGNAATTFSSVAVGMIRSHVRLTDATATAAKRLQLKILFALDGHGNVLERSLVQPSGSPDFDAAIMQAVKEAGPFPTPPMGLPMSLTLTYGGEDYRGP